MEMGEGLELGGRVLMDDLGAYVQPWDVGVKLTERERVGL